MAHFSYLFTKTTGQAEAVPYYFLRLTHILPVLLGKLFKIVNEWNSWASRALPCLWSAERSPLHEESSCT